MTRKKRSISRHSHFLAAPAEAVFPLLCPVREYEWIEWWRGKLLYSDSGLAELDCVFQSEAIPAVGPETWTCSRYEPPRRVDYVRLGRHTVIRLELTLEPAGAGTRITALLVITAVTEAGDGTVAGMGPDFCALHFGPGFLMLDHYLRTGTMLPGEQALALAREV